MDLHFKTSGYPEPTFDIINALWETYHKRVYNQPHQRLQWL